MDYANVKPYILGIAGGSCSGKTTFSRRLRERAGESHCSILYQDNYYYHIDFDKKHLVNFDEPSSIDFELLSEHLRALKLGREALVPSYDFATYARLERPLLYKPKPLIVLEGMLILTQKEIREFLDESIFIEADEDTRFNRRLERDVLERGRTAESVQEQFLSQVNPMHLKYVQPSASFARRRVSQDQYLTNIDTLISDILKRVSVARSRPREVQAEL